MRFLRVASLVAGIALVVMGLLGIVGRRDELSDQRDRRLETAAELVATQLDTTIARVVAVLTVAAPDLSADVLADALALPVCSVTDGGASCSQEQPVEATDPTVVAALQASARRGAPAVVVRADAAAAPTSVVVIAVDQGGRRLYVPLPHDASVLPNGDVQTSLVPLDGEPLFRPRTVDGRRTIAAPSMVEFEDGPWAVRVIATDDVELSAGERWLFGTQLVLGSVLALVALGGLISEHRTLHRRATTDTLTKLPNREEFERRATELLSRLERDSRPACLFVIDLDNFKVVNDTVGHDAGDRVLADAAVRLRQAVRSSDLVGRWGGDEFVVLMPGIGDARSVPARAGTIANALAGMPAVGPFSVEASVGAALFPTHGTRLEDLLRKADRAMYTAKVQVAAPRVAVDTADAPNHRNG